MGELEKSASLGQGAALFGFSTSTLGSVILKTRVGVRAELGNQGLLGKLDYWEDYQLVINLLTIARFIYIFQALLT